MRESDSGDLCLGAEAIARDVFGGQLTPRQIYRLAEERNPPWPIFRLRGKLCARLSAMHAEIARREAAAGR